MKVDCLWRESRLVNRNGVGRDDSAGEGWWSETETTALRAVWLSAETPDSGTGKIASRKGNSGPDLGTGRTLAFNANSRSDLGRDGTQLTPNSGPDSGIDSGTLDS